MNKKIELVRIQNFVMIDKEVKKKILILVRYLKLYFKIETFELYNHLNPKLEK